MVGSALVPSGRGRTEHMHRLGTHAFHTVLSRKTTRFASVLASLRMELSKGRHRRFKVLFRDVVAEGIAGTSDIAF
jgi:hypothetical protein